MMGPVGPFDRRVLQEKGTVTKKEIVQKIAVDIKETQLKTKEIVQLTFNAIVDTLITDRRIELRNFGVFEVRLRKARKARNPRTEEPVEVPPKFTVHFKPGKEMEERVKELVPTAEELEALEATPTRPRADKQADTNGVSPQADGQRPPKKKRPRKASQA